MRIERIRLRGVGPFDDVTIDLPAGKAPDLADVYLLTGPNGSGKSTILYAIATVLAGARKELGHELLLPRLRSTDSYAAVLADGEAFMATYAGQTFVRQPSLPNPFGNGELFSAIHAGSLGYYERSVDPHSYSHLAAADHTDPLAGTRFQWAAFAYAGIRPMSEVHITAIQEPKTSPFKNSLSFLQTADTNLLANWIVSQNYRRLKAKEAGALEQAEQLERSVRTIEQIIAEIIEDPSFGFAITETDDDVRVRWKGMTVRLEVLPDGLQSIVSWIADLLMRLYRIPWVDNTPILQRHFLLLLDEIDLHLHPAWQRRILPLVQRLFPNAQIIASTHSPFVVGSLADGRVISLGLQGSTATVVSEEEPQLGVSYSAVLRSIFGIESEFDIDTERKLQGFHAARRRLLAGEEGARAEVDRIANELAQRSEELRGLIGLEMGQLRRQLAQRAAAS